MNAQLLAVRHPDEVAGVVLVDSLHPDLDEKIEAVARRAGRAGAAGRSPGTVEGVTYADLLASDDVLRAARGDFPPVPLIALQHGISFDLGGEPVPSIERLWGGCRRPTRASAYRAAWSCSPSRATTGSPRTSPGRGGRDPRGRDRRARRLGAARLGAGGLLGGQRRPGRSARTGAASGRSMTAFSSAPKSSTMLVTQIQTSRITMPANAVGRLVGAEVGDVEEERPSDASSHASTPNIAPGEIQRKRWIRHVGRGEVDDGVDQDHRQQREWPAREAPDRGGRPAEPDLVEDELGQRAAEEHEHGRGQHGASTRSIQPMSCAL